MAKYKLTVKYNDVCELSLASDIPDIIGSEFDQYVKSMLYKKEDWENFETNFKEAARLEYGKLSKKRKEAEDNISDSSKANKPTEQNENADNTPQEAQETSETTEEQTNDTVILDEVECDIECIDDALDFNENNNVVEKKDKESITVAVEEKSEKPAKKEKKNETLSFADYIKNKNINTPLDEFVAGACYLDEIANIKEFSLKQLNAKLYPAFGRLANSEVIENAIERVLIETVKSGSATKYKINENAWNYHNYDLVRH